MLSEIMRECEAMLRHRDMYYAGDLCTELQCAFEELSRSVKTPSASVHDDASFGQGIVAGFSRVIVLDARRAVSAAGLFDFDLFVEVIATAIAEALGFDLDARNLHREQLSQFLKDERNILFCFFSLDWLTEEHYRQLRGLGFTQTDHRILFCGRSEFLQEQSASLAEPASWESTFGPVRTVQFESEDGHFESEDDSFGGSVEMAHLRILNGQTYSLHVFPSPGTSIGRVGGDCDLRIYDDRVSRRHARIVRSTTGWQLEDLYSRNRGFVDGDSYEPGAQVPLVDGSVLRLADTLMTFRSSPPTFDLWADSMVCPGVSPMAVAVRRQFDQLVAGSGHVLIVGATGVGKKRVAHAFGEQRAPHSFVTLNSNDVRRAEARAALFGRRTRASIRATNYEPGPIEKADNGVLFFAEVGELPIEFQSELLRFLYDGLYLPIDSTELRHSNARVVAATRVDLDEAVRRGTFRSDLLWRLRAANPPLRLPSLRERREDILGWTELFFRECNRDPGRHPWTAGALECLLLYPWNGNLRELRSVVGHAAESATAWPCGIEHLPAEVSAYRTMAPGTALFPGCATAPLPPMRAKAPLPRGEPTQSEIEHVLRETLGDMRIAAQRLDVERRKLYRLCERFGIDREQYRGKAGSDDE